MNGLFDMKTKWAVTVVFLCAIGGCVADEEGEITQTASTIAGTTGIGTTPAAPAEKMAQTEPRTHGQAARPAKYSGTLPCADCPGIETVLVLIGDGTYSLSETYLEQDTEAFVATGRFTWSSAGNVITLDAEGRGRSYKAQENSLRALDSNGQVIRGKLAEYYVLESVDAEYSGVYVWGHNVHAFSPCDSELTYSVIATTETIEQIIKHYKLKSTRAYQPLFVQFRGHPVTDDTLLEDIDDYDGLIRINEVLEWEPELPTQCSGR